MESTNNILDKAIRAKQAQINTDFLTEWRPNKDRLFDRIIANPPFTKNQDIDHVYHMYNCLKSGGVMVLSLLKVGLLEAKRNRLILEIGLNQLGQILKLLKRESLKSQEQW